MISFENDAFAEYRQWEKDDKNIFKKINSLITEIMRDPFKGTGKPEPLKHNWAGHWSRRITEEHRLIYKVTNDEIFISSCKSHY
ncbi:MAG: Txe/YoeB family addiction module toxin [Treponema sp.]|nr:Txe/YoeB family addiction module toxin [Treponema sp.]